MAKGTIQEILESVEDDNRFKVTLLNGESFGLVSTTPVDLTVVGDNLLYTVPEGKKFWPSDHLYETLTNTARGDDASVNMGYTNPDYNDYVNAELPFPSATIGALFSNALGGYINTYSDQTPAPAGTEIYYRVASADSGTANDINVLLMGFLIDA